MLKPPPNMDGGMEKYILKKRKVKEGPETWRDGAY
jgi:hypothetical protein